MEPDNRPAVGETDKLILTLNAGSTSVKFAFFAVGDPLRRTTDGNIERVGEDAAVGSLIDGLAEHSEFRRVAAVGHRVVHGMHHDGPALVTPDLIEELRAIAPYDPDHMPREIELIEEIAKRLPDVPQVACFDTAFHRTMPRVARLLPLPRRFDAQGIQRYGFHGLSYAFLVEELKRLGDPAATDGRVILAHLGGGASLAAVLNGRSVDTTMAFTPTAGLMMATRTGDLDPGVMTYLAKQEGYGVDALQHLVNQESGLLGVSETSADMRDLLGREAEDPRAREAVDLFCYQAKKWIGAFAAALGGLDTLVFAGGIGEHAPAVRARICAGLDYLRIELDAEANSRNASVISVVGSLPVRVIRTDEEQMIARSVESVVPSLH
jgi:acetate kinase